MKLWLFDILACPICKNYPLELYIFSYQTDDKQFETYLKNYQNQNINNFEDQDIIKISRANEDIDLIRDNIIVEKKSPKEYLDAVLLSIKELDHVEDLSPIKYSKKCLNVARKTIYEEISKLTHENKPENFKEILNELIFLNKLKIDAEIDSGILFCKKCNRWYPIIETIPRMLPDKYRDKEKELKFLKNKKNLLHEDFFKLDLKPFNL